MVYPVASLVKVPLAVAVLDRTVRGSWTARDDRRAAGPPASGFEAGLSQFRHTARIAVDDLLYLAVAISDNPAADALFELVPPGEVTDVLRGYGIAGISVRHPMRGLAERRRDVQLAQTLAIGAREAGLGHGLPQLDVTRTNRARRVRTSICSAALDAVGDPRRGGRSRPCPDAQNTMRQRLGPDFSSDASAWSSKTGTLLNFRHEVGVVEHEDGYRFAVAALTESRARRLAARRRSPDRPRRARPARPPARVNHGVMSSLMCLRCCSRRRAWSVRARPVAVRRAGRAAGCAAEQMAVGVGAGPCSVADAGGARMPLAFPPDTAKAEPAVTVSSARRSRAGRRTLLRPCAGRGAS